MSIVTLIKKRGYISKVSENHFREAEVQVVINWIFIINLANVKSKPYAVFTPSRILVNHRQPEIIFYLKPDGSHENSHNTILII